MPTATILAFIAGSILTLYLGYLELRKDRKNWVILSVFVALFCLFLGAGLYDILEKDSQDNEKHEDVISTTIIARDTLRAVIDSTREAIFDSLGIGNKKINNKLDSLNQINNISKIEPTLVLNNEVNNPFISYGEDTILNFGVKSINSEAYIRSYRFLIFWGGNGFLREKPIIHEGSFSSQAAVIESNTTKGFLLFLNRLPIRAENLVVVFQMKYYNSKNKVRPLFQRMVAIDNFKVGLMTDSEFNKIESLVVKYKY